MKIDRLNLYTRPPLTLRDPPTISTGLRAITRETARVLKHAYQRRQVPNFRNGGHSAVTSSLRRGLSQIGATHTMNRRSAPQKPIRTAGVLAGIRTLQWIALEAAQGNIERAIVGPNVTVFPSEAEEILTSDVVAQVLVPSNWVKDLYIADQPLLAGKVAVWSSGVDIDYWSPRGADFSRTKCQCLIYLKNSRDSDLEAVTSVCKSLGINVKVIRYGNYSKRQYRAALDESKFMIYLGSSESQGLALLEAWSMGVPTLVRKLRERPSVLEHFPEFDFDPNELSAPYLSDGCGAIWDTLESLIENIEDLNDHAYSPRVWVIENGTDAASAFKYVQFWSSIGF